MINRAGKDSCNGSLSYLFAVEAKQAERGRDYTRAEQLLREALKTLPGDRVYIINLATVLAKESKNDEALKLLEDAKKGCGDEVCRREYTNELNRQEQIGRILQRLKRKS